MRRRIDVPPTRAAKRASGRRASGPAAAAFAAVLCTGPLLAAEAAPRATPVVTAKAERRDVPIVVKGLGTVQAFNLATIRSQVTGFLQTVGFTEGSAVRKGDVLATVQPDVFQARLDQAQGQLERDEAQLANLDVNIGRNEPLLKQGYATDLQVADQKAKASELRAAVKVDQASVAYARTELDFTKLRAPFDGITGERLIDVGNLVRPTDVGGVTVLTQVQPISVIVTVAASDIPAVQAALEQGTVPVVVYDQTGTRKLDAGSLLLVDNQAQTATGTVRLKANLPNASRRLWPGTFVVGEVTTGVERGALTVPTDAIQLNDRGQFVFVVGADGKAAIRPVEVTQRQRGLALVGNGLREGERVVVEGQYGLAAGSPVVEAAPEAVQKTTTGSLGMLP